ncbi:MAG: phosphoribosylaminoimidazolesuccinocarboxamide synthase [Calditrichaeota bacterium]|nr:MAG: phosphoribosylaminoimidazolesuccinocarboxamide synthase [Calditrichota bacterium]MBL1206435.1 phosphoribosylaminoimidazolesuccinocarboxamide synthase [Calditrichota bacterium]NOG46262.1 phosphoribosylaminoimidazolesuccinocarboxamide synthase [Calditrichota bacterium]
MLNQKEIINLVEEYGNRVNEGRPIRKIIEDGDLPRLSGATVLDGKVSDSVFAENLKTKNGIPIRLMFRGNRISTHDENRGAIPFKDQVLAQNHDHMLNLVKYVLGTSQFDVPGLKPSSTVIPAENLQLIMLENVLRMYMAESSTSTSLYQHWLKAKEEGLDNFTYALHAIEVNSLVPNGPLAYLMDTPSTKDKIDKTVDPYYLVENNICTQQQYKQIRNASIMAFGIITQYLKEKGMVLVDTKTEHGINSKGKIVSADELYTMDSSRFWKLNDDGSIASRDNKPVSFSKEFARGMVKEKGQQFTEEQSNEIAVRYIQGLQNLTGKSFEPDLRPRDQRIIESTNLILDYLL